MTRRASDDITQMREILGGPTTQGAPGERELPGAGRPQEVDVAEDSPTPTSVYRYYDRFGVLIYVGITSRALLRQREHNDTKEWWPFVARQEVEHYPTRDVAALHERSLIAEFLPPFNRHHNPHHQEMRSAYLDRVRELGDQPVTAKQNPGLFGMLDKGRLPLTQFPRESEFLCSSIEHNNLARLVTLRPGERVPVRSPRRIMTGVRRVSMRGPVLVIETKIPLPALRVAEVKLAFRDGTRESIRLDTVFVDPVVPESIEDCQRRRTGRKGDGFRGAQRNRVA